MYQRNSNNYCTNCGRQGHSIKRCQDPVLSLGIVAFKFVNNEPHLIMIQRRNSLCYVEFLRGKYNTNNKDYILNLFDNMANKEIQDLKTKNFETLWNELWINNEKKQYKNDYYTAEQKFNELDIEDIVSKKTQFNETPEWGFPKGRRNYKEHDVDCAEREFTEETGLSEENISILKNVIPIREDFTGNNGVRYRHIYYLAKIKNDHTELKLDPTNLEQIVEIGDIKCLNKVECLNRIRDDDLLKKKIVNNICNFLVKMNNNFYLNRLN